MAYNPTYKTITKSAKINAGETFVIPSGATIDSIISEGGATAVSDCDLPETEEYICSYFRVIFDSSGVEGRPMDEKTTFIDTITVGESVFNFDKFKPIENDGADSVPPTVNDLNNFISEKYLFQFTRVGYEQVGQRQYVWFHFKTVESYYSYIEMKMLDNDNPVYFKPVEKLDCNSTDNP